ERASSLKRASSHTLRAASPHGGAAIDVTSSCKSSNSRACERNQANASWTLRNSAARATCCCAERDAWDSLKGKASVEEARAGGPGPMADAPILIRRLERAKATKRQGSQPAHEQTAPKPMHSGLEFALRVRNRRKLPCKKGGELSPSPVRQRRHRFVGFSDREIGCTACQN